MRNDTEYNLDNDLGRERDLTGRAMKRMDRGVESPGDTVV
jgi:hypothetical protein